MQNDGPKEPKVAEAVMEGGPKTEEPIQPDSTLISKDDVATQFAVIKTKDGRIAVQFPLLDPATQTVDLPLALDLAGAGLQTLARVVRMQMSQALAMMQEKPRIAVVPTLPPQFRNKP
jgi:hypothetical protein